jgi:hypothetical protein
MDVKVKFVLGAINEEEVQSLEEGYAIISKMILMQDDYNIFHYKLGDSIQVETDHGYRLWCSITQLEVIQDKERVIIIFTLIKAPEKNQALNSIDLPF